MHDFDFLPAKFHQRQKIRKSRFWLGGVFFMFAVVIVTSSLFQYAVEANIQEQVDCLTQSYEKTKVLEEQGHNLKKVLSTTRSDAGLYAYLRHPWPRTQILAAVVESLPDSVMLAQIQIHRESTISTPDIPVHQRRRVDQQKEDIGKLLPSQRDIKQLRKTYDAGDTIVSIEGVTTHVGSLHRYLRGLEEFRLIEKAELSSIESLENSDQPGASQFSARLMVRPGYGQPGTETTVDVAQVSLFNQ